MRSLHLSVSLISVCRFMSEPPVLRHPYAIMKALPKSFGYTSAFLEGKLGWDFTAPTGGGRQTLGNIKELVKELADYTMVGEDLETRQATLKSLFQGHYDLKRVIFLVRFFLELVPCPPSISKEKAVDLLVENNVPFIPCDFAAAPHCWCQKVYNVQDLFCNQLRA